MPKAPPRRALSSLLTLAAFAVLAAVVAVVVVAAPDPDAAFRAGPFHPDEVTVVWVPRAMLDLARRDPTPPPRAPEALRAYLDRHGLRGTWYAVSWRTTRISGRRETVTRARGTGTAVGDLGGFHEVLATAAGRPPRHDGRDFTHAEVRVIPDDLLNADPRAAVYELADLPASARAPD